MNRRDFFIRMGGAALAVPIALKLGACSDDAPDEPDANNGPDAPPQAACANGTTVEIVDPHGHVMEVTTQDIEAGVDKEYQIQGASPHPHTVTVTAADFQRLANNETVQVISSNDAAHEHTINIVCV